MPDYQKLYYESQAQLAELADELRRMVLQIQHMMRESEEQVLNSDESDQNV